MKTLLTILLITGFVACKKCKDCTTVYTYIPTTANIEPPTVVQHDVCDDDLKSIDGKTTISTSPDGNGGTVQVIQKTTCK
jgi:hypothetical protein